MDNNQSNLNSKIDVHGDGTLILSQVQAGKNITINHYKQETPTPFSPISDVPKLPKRHFPRPHLVEEINRKLSKSANSSENNICIILGPKGHGKTTLVAEWCQNRQDIILWLDASKQGELKASKIPENTTIIIDYLDDAPDSFLQERIWIKQLRGKIIVLTSQKKIADQLQSEWRVVNQNVIIELNTGFTTQECLEFLNCTIPNEVCSEFDQEIIKDLNQTMCGSPWFWQFVSTLVHEDDFPRLAEGLRNPNSLEVRDKTYYKLFAKWASIEGKQSQAFNVAYLLSCISLLGMNTDALAFVLDKESNQIKEALEILQKIGFVRKVGGFDNYWLPHDLLRNMCKEIVKEEALIKKRERYRLYFQRKICSQNLERGDLHTLLDAWLLCVGDNFDRAFFTYANGHKEPFFSSFEKLSVQLDKIMESFKQQNAKENAIAKFVAEGASKLGCQNLIPASRLLAKSKSPNVEIARLLKVVFKCEDSMARAEVVHAASIHWTKQTTEIALEGREVLLNEIKEYERVVGSSKAEDYHNQFVICACLTGLCILGETEKAINISRQENILQRFPFGELAVFLHLLSEKKHEVIIPFFSQLKPQGLWIENVFPFIQRYVSNLGYSFGSENIPKFIFNPNIPLFLATLSNNSDFYTFVYNYCRKAKQIEEKSFELENF